MYKTDVGKEINRRHGQIMRMIKEGNNFYSNDVQQLRKEIEEIRQEANLTNRKEDYFKW